MKYLQYRNEFLNKKVQFDKNKLVENFKTSSLILENTPTVTNDITFGASLIGRLWNSFIRLAKIGYNKMQVPSLLEKLKQELDYLVSASLTGEAKEKLDTLMLKSFLEEIKVISEKPSKNEDDEIEILQELIGDYGKKVGGGTSQNPKLKDLYDPEDKNKGQKTEGKLQEFYDQLKNNYPDLKIIFGKVKRDYFLDILSDYNDELRAYYYSLLGGVGNNSTSQLTQFKNNFGHLIMSISKNRVTTP
jgi:hypothetical protein